jgi:molybdopterin converting factor small subunit
MSIRATDIHWMNKKGEPKIGYYMDEFLGINLMGIPEYLRKSWDVVGIISGHGRVRIGKCLSENTQVRLIDEKGIITTSKALREYNDGDKLNTLSINPITGEIVPTVSEVIKELEDKDFYTLELEDGRTIECTMDHKFYVKVNNQIKVLPLKEIKEGDEIICIKD